MRPLVAIDTLATRTFPLWFAVSLILQVIMRLGELDGLGNPIWTPFIPHTLTYLQVALPKTILPRYQHTATAFGSGPDCRQLVLWGGKTEWKLVMCEALGMEVWGGEPIGETTLLNFGEDELLLG